MPTGAFRRTWIRWKVGSSLPERGSVSTCRLLALFPFLLLFMLSFETLLSFTGLCLLLAAMPGPDNLFVVLQSAQHGWRAGLCVVVGLCVGVMGHTTAVALGLAAALLASPQALALLQWGGAAYLAWMAWQAWRAPVHAVPLVGQGAPAGEKASSTAAPAPLRMVLRGVAMNLSNPKVLVFFLAFLPQFADAARGPVAGQILLLGGVFMACTLLVFGGMAYFSCAAGAFLQSSVRARTWLNRVAALVFVGMALRLALGTIGTA